MLSQGMEQFQKATQQIASATEKAAHSPHNTTSKTAK